MVQTCRHRLSENTILCQYMTTQVITNTHTHTHEWAGQNEYARTYVILLVCKVLNKYWPKSPLFLAWRDKFRSKPVMERSSLSLLVRMLSISTGSMRCCSRATRLSTEAHCGTKRKTQFRDESDFYYWIWMWLMLYSLSCLQLWCSA